MMKRFFCGKIEEKEGRALIKDEEFHYLRNVLRLKKGVNLVIFDGKMEYLAYIEEVTNNKAYVRIIENLRTFREPRQRVVLVQGIPKGDKMDFIIQKSTELGVSVIVPLITTRTLPHLKDDRAIKKQERWQRIALEASRQCGRPCVPDVHPVVTFSDFLSQSFNALRFILWEGEEKRRLRDFRAFVRDSKDIVITIGPEGGFSKEEVEMSREKGFISVSLGNRMLRTETASIVTLSILLHMGGDLG